MTARPRRFAPSGPFAPSRPGAGSRAGAPRLGIHPALLPTVVQRLAPAQAAEEVAALGHSAGNRAVAELFTGSRAPGPASTRRPPVQRFVGGGFTEMLSAMRDAMNVDIAGSVGARGRNHPSDVRRVQTRLVLLGFLAGEEAQRERPASADAAGDVAVPDAGLAATVAAITRYQSDVVGLRRADGRVDAGGRTQRALAAGLKARPAPPAAGGAAGTTTGSGVAAGAGAAAAAGQAAGAAPATGGGDGGGSAQGLGTASGVTATEFRRRHAEELRGFRGSEDEITLLVDMIVRRGITDVDAMSWTRKPKHEWSLAPAVFVKRHGDERLASPTADDTRELASIKFGIVYPLLKFVVPRVTAAPTLTEGSSVGERIASASHDFLGTRYVLGGCQLYKTKKQRDDCGARASAKSDGIDCSGLVVRTLSQLGLPYKWSGAGNGVTRFVTGGTFIQHSDSPETGDLVLRQKAGDWRHIGIYVGGGAVIHAPYTGTVVRKESFKSDKWDGLKLRYPPVAAGPAR